MFGLNQMFIKELPIKNNETGPLTFIAEEYNCKMSLEFNQSKFSFQISLNDEPWVDYNSNQEIILTNIGDFVKIQAKEFNDLSKYDEGDENGVLTHFNINNGKIAASGIITSLYYREPDSITNSYINLIDKFYFEYLFANCSALTQAPCFEEQKLKCCLRGMFLNCVALREGVRGFLDLYSENVGPYDYTEVFNGCTQLCGWIDIHAKNVDENASSWEMFHKCSNLSFIRFYNLSKEQFIKGFFEEMNNALQESYINCTIITSDAIFKIVDGKIVDGEQLNSSTTEDE